MTSRQRGFALPLALRFFFATAVLIALAVGAAIVVTTVQGQRIAAGAVDKSLATSAAVQREFESRRLEQLQNSVGFIAADASFVKYIADATSTSSLPGLGGDATPDTGSIRDLLNDRQKEFGFDVGILLDSQGEVLARTDASEAFRESFASDPMVGLALRVSSPFSGYWRLNDRLYQAAIVPLTQDQAVVGFLLLALSVDDNFSRKVAQVTGAQIAFWIPVADKLQLAASSFEGEALNDYKRAAESVAAQVAPAIKSGTTIERINVAFAGQDWVAKVSPTRTIDDPSRAATWEPDEAALGVVMVLASADQIVASYRSILNSVLLAGLASMIAALLLSFVITKGILRPVRAMAKAAEDAAAGNFQARLGVEGNDELARLARAFDSLLSDLREKSDMEGYVGNLARFLPEPGQEGGPVVEFRTRSVGAVKPPFREQVALLGLEFRHLLTLPSDTPADQVYEASRRVADAIKRASASESCVSRHAGGARWMLAFAGPTRRDDALRALASLLPGNGHPPAAAIAEGNVVLASHDDTVELLGAIQVQVERLLCDAAPGQVLLAKNTGDAIKAQFGDSAIAVATGGFSGKQYYALQSTLLEQIAAEEPIAEVDHTDATIQRDAVRLPTSTPRSEPARPSRDAAGELAPGSTLGGRYRVLSVLGAGGMGVVYKAHDLELDDVVALKMLKPGALLDAEQLERLEGEIELARRITHPNVLRTFDFGEVNGIPYISMEYVRGLTLRYLLREAKRVPYSAGLRIARQLAAGLSAAHEVGVLHRDIKPENLILEANGNAKLMDFGIARPARRVQPGHTQPGTFLGTPNYCAPEQLAGDEVDERADIYSCGVLMTEMFCGALPFSGSNTMEIYMAQMQQEPTRPSTLWPEIRPELEDVILRCLKRNPAERPASAAALAAALAQLRA